MFVFRDKKKTSLMQSAPHGRTKNLLLARVIYVRTPMSNDSWRAYAPPTMRKVVIEVKSGVGEGRRLLKVQESVDDIALTP